MIDTLSVISNGGAVLWQTSSHATGRAGMINRLVQEVLLEDRAGVRDFTVDDYKLRWSLENESGFFVVAVFPKFVVPHYMEDFLRDVVRAFASLFSKASIAHPHGHSFEFAETYRALSAKLEASERGGADDYERDASATASSSPSSAGDDDDGEQAKEAEEADAPESSAAARRDGSVLVAKDGRRIGARGRAGAAAPNGGAQAQSEPQSSPCAPAAGSPSPAGSKKGKKPTKWDAGMHDPAVARQTAKASAAELEAQAEIQRRTYIKRLPNGAVAPVKEKEWESQPRGRLATWLRAYVGGSRAVDQQDLSSITPRLREKLISKNVAVLVADHVCKSVEASLEGKKLGTFDSLRRTVEDAMTASLRRILQPKHEVNILRGVAAAKSRGKPYVIVLCGVNGVGKSTSLAKIAYWLQQNGHSLLIAAGDTFRHGAVEQLEVHGRCLGVPVFQMGYNVDPSSVAGAAIAQAARQHADVVMIDTAGRMQDHESRMRALAKLIHDNQPDLVLFVGEALVGNNGVDQLRKFNQCLVDYAPVGAPRRGIDGIVLTKFDTIDDKVGAALSMVYELGQPIVFVGVGQTYQDLKVIEPEVVVSALMN